MDEDFSAGCAFLEGRYVPIADARIPVLDMGFSRSDCTYDVVSVWHGAFFRLAEHLARFERSCACLRLDPGLTRGQLAAVLGECVARSGLREAYVEMIATRGELPAGEAGVAAALASVTPAASPIASTPMPFPTSGSPAPNSRWLACTSWSPRASSGFRPARWTRR